MISFVWATDIVFVGHVRKKKLLLISWNEAGDDAGISSDWSIEIDGSMGSCGIEMRDDDDDDENIALFLNLLFIFFFSNSCLDLKWNKIALFK